MQKKEIAKKRIDSSGGGGEQMKIKIMDPIGCKTGIRVSNVAFIETGEEDEFHRIYGTLSAPSDVYGNLAEPVVVANVLDQDARVIYSCQGNSPGMFWLSRYSTFSINLDKKAFDMEKVDHITLYLVYELIEIAVRKNKDY